MFCYVLCGELEPDVTSYATRFCRRWRRVGCTVTRGEGKVVVGFRDKDRAALFLNLFEGEIERAFEASPDALTVA